MILLKSIPINLNLSKSMKYIFIRNDDVRNTLDDSLISITDLCIEKNIPICHTVEPANVSEEVVKWLNANIVESPNLIEIVQHGYSHKLNYKKFIGGKLKKGEFGGSRSYEKQLLEIHKGKEIMDSFFGDKWFSLFTFPYGARNIESLRAIKKAGFLAVNGSMGISVQHKFLYFIGRLLNAEMLFGRKISYNLKYKKGSGLFQIDTSFSIIKQYLNDDDEAIFYDIEELKDKTMKYLKSTNNIGIVLHHRYHNSDEKIQLVNVYFDWLKKLPNVEFVTQKFLYSKFK